MIGVYMIKGLIRSTTLALMVSGLTIPAFAQTSIGKQAVEELISKMTLEEKIDYIGGYNRFNVRPVPHLNIPEIRIADGPVGVRNFGPSTAYPASITVAASLDKSVAHDIGEAIGMEAKNKKITGCQSSPKAKRSVASV